MLNLVPPLYRWLAIALMIAAVWGHGYVKGRQAGEDKLDAVVARIQAERDQEAIRAGKRRLEQEERLNAVIRDFHLGIGAINDHWMRNRPAPVRLPATPKAAAGAQDDGADTVPLGQYSELERICAITTRMFNACRDGWMGLER